MLTTFIFMQLFLGIKGWSGYGGHSNKEFRRDNNNVNKPTKEEKRYRGFNDMATDDYVMRRFKERLRRK